MDSILNSSVPVTGRQGFQAINADDPLSLITPCETKQEIYNELLRLCEENIWVCISPDSDPVLACARIDRCLFYINFKSTPASLESIEAPEHLERAVGRTTLTRNLEQRILALQQSLVPTPVVPTPVVPTVAVPVTHEQAEEMNNLSTAIATPQHNQGDQGGDDDSDDREIEAVGKAAEGTSALSTPQNTPQKRRRGARRRLEQIGRRVDKEVATLDTTPDATVALTARNFFKSHMNWLGQQVTARQNDIKRVNKRVQHIQQLIQEEDQRHAHRKSKLQSMLEEAQLEELYATQDLRQMPAILQKVKDQSSQIETELHEKKRSRMLQVKKKQELQTKMKALEEQQRALRQDIQNLL